MLEQIKSAFEMLRTGVEENIFPGAVACVGNKDGIIYSDKYGFRQVYPYKEKMQLDTLFDIASLTKVVATLPLLMEFLQKGKISLYDAVGDYLEPFQSENELKIIHLLTHTSGFEAYSRMDQKGIKPEEVVSYISKTKRVNLVGKAVVYSDYNFILLKYILVDIAREPFETACKKYVFDPLEMKHTMFNPKHIENVAATEFCEERKEYLKGIVHDENARYFGGVSGHAGIFSNLLDLSKYCSMYLRDGKSGHDELLFSPTTIDCIVNNYTKGLQESRGLGFCVKSQEVSSGGELLSEGSFGHTGFTGTSLWIDRKRGVYIILLTNRVHLTRDNIGIIKFRRHFHNAVNYAVERYR